LKTWFFTEDCYPDLPPQDEWESIRVELPEIPSPFLSPGSA